MKVRLTQFLRRAAHVSVLGAAIAASSSGSFAFGGDNPRITPIVEAIRKTEAAVVNIQGNKTVANTSANGVSTRQEVNGMGTGVIIDRRGLIITNYHVVDSVERIEVTLADGTTTIAKLVNYDPETDLAMIKINVDWELPTINVGRSDDLLRGETVIAIGNPFGYQNTVTVGIISALHRNIPVNGSQQYTDLIQTNADINPGNSGGPLLNTNGEVIGINVAVRVGAQGIGFAIPIDNALDVMANLVAQYRKSGAHGLLCQRVPGDSGCQLIVREYQSASNKSSRDIRTGDEIITVGGVTVRNQLEVELALLDRDPGDTVDIELGRNGHSVVQSIVLDRTSVVSEDAEILRNAWERIGVRVTPVNASQLKGLGEEYKGGLKITEIRPGSPAARERLSPGDVIVGVMNWQTPNLKSLAWVMANNSYQSSLTAKYYLIRRDQAVTVALGQDRTRR
ncbi:trypsin-like peptidase domain-containing protein [Pirellulaceae bacterium SH449]